MPEFNGVSFEQGVIAGRPINPDDLDPDRKKVWDKVVKTQAPPPLYPGHIQRDCMICGVRVQVGPRQQAALEQFPDMPIMCLVDATLWMAANADSPDDGAIVDLGNPYKEKA